MSAFLWIIDEVAYNYIKSNGGVSRNYILPNSTASKYSERLSGSDLWIIIRNKQKEVLFAKLNISKVEQFEEGYYKNDYIITIDMLNSIRTVSDLDSFETWTIELSEKYPLGMTDIDTNISDKLNQNILNRIGCKLTPPSKISLKNLSSQNFKGNLKYHAKRSISDVVSKLSLSELWSFKTSNIIPPYANFSYHKIEMEHGKEFANKIYPFLELYDPTTKINYFINDDIVKNDKKNFEEPEVDIEMVEINPDKIYARKFISKKQSYLDVNEIIEKTEIAEKLHQDILRDLSEYLKKNGLTPLQSSSIDLAIKHKNEISFFEIKTTNNNNFFQQASKGLFQLICYKKALIENDNAIKKIGLIVTRPIDPTLESYITNVLLSVGINTYYYDTNKNWPDRLVGFIESLV